MEKNYSKKTSPKNENKPKRKMNFSAKTGKMVYVGNLRYTMDEKDIFKMFIKFGYVGEVNIIRKPGTDESKGIAFVEMQKASEADQAITSLNGTVMGGRTIKVSEAIDNRDEDKKFNPQKAYAIKEAKKEKVVEETIVKKKFKRKTGLDELFANIGRK